jgi:hypothetical protein
MRYNLFEFIHDKYRVIRGEIFLKPSILNSSIIIRISNLQWKWNLPAEREVLHLLAAFRVEKPYKNIFHLFNITKK